ncbi:MAG: hypothetical protein LBS42_05030 [Tannerella sp.]|jgi:hypothetical protein|nr:hypothetical protein [Tannerella sp.]
MKQEVRNSKNDLNAFLRLILTISVPYSIIRQIAECINYLTYYNDQYFGLFCTVGCITVAIHAFGIYIILSKKDLMGVCIVLWNQLLVRIILIPWINGMLDYEIFDVSRTIIHSFLQLIGIPLLLLLKSGGKSAYTVLNRNYESSIKQEADSDVIPSSEIITEANPTVIPSSKILSIIVYILVGIVVALCIYSLVKIL